MGTAYGLGASWLARPFIGVPLGVWFVAGAAAGVHAAIWSSRFETDADDVPATYPHRRTGGLFGRFGSVTGAARLVLASASISSEAAAATALELAGVPARHVRRARHQVERLLRRARAAHDALEIGVDLPESEANAVIGMGAAGRAGDRTLAGVEVCWDRAPSGLVTDGPQDAKAFDALIRASGDDNIAIFTNEDPAHEAAWYDWTVALPMSYPGVFPARVDVSRVSLGPVNVSDPARARLVSSLALAAAVLSRSPVRLGGSASLEGLRAGLRCGRFTLPDASRAVAAAMTQVADVLVAIGPGDGGSEQPGTDRACAAAARVLSAYLATTPADFDAAERVHLVETAAEFLPNEPEVRLRLAAVQIAAGRSDQGLTTLVQVFRELRAAGVTCQHDPLLFILAEASHAGGDRLTVGRACAGLALACATVPGDRFTYLREDLLDDLRHGGWLASQEGDLALIEETVRVLESEASAQAPKKKRKSRLAA